MLKAWSTVAPPGGGGAFERRGPVGSSQVSLDMPLMRTVELWALPLSSHPGHEVSSSAVQSAPGHDVLPDQRSKLIGPTDHGLELTKL